MSNWSKVHCISLTFMSSEGIKVDPTKIAEITKMPNEFSNS